MTPTPMLVAAAAATLLLTGCSGTSSETTPDEKGLNVVVAFYPQQFAAEQVAGDHARVTNLTTPGTEPHDLELTPKQIASLAAADLVIYQKGFQSQVDAAVEQQKPKNVIDIATVVELHTAGHDHGAAGQRDGHDHGGLDPHAWLDPVNMVKITRAVATKLGEIDPAAKADFDASATKSVEALTTLDKDYQTGLATCKVREIITTHEAFGYLAERYKLTQIGISGLSPDAEPSPARIAEVQKLAKEHGATTIFYETLASPAVAKSIAGDLGLKTDVLDPLEGLTDQSRGKNYIEVMQSNLTALKTANGCS